MGIEGWTLWLQPCLRQRVGAWYLREATHQVRGRHGSRAAVRVATILLEKLDGCLARRVETARITRRELKTWLGELSAADRQAPACYATGGTTLRTRFRTGTSPACQPLARPNRQFFNASVPRSAAQVVIIAQISICFDHQPALTGPWGCPANRQLLQTLDQQAVLSWLK